MFLDSSRAGHNATVYAVDGRRETLKLVDAERCAGGDAEVPAHGGRGVGNDGVVFPAAAVVVQHHPSRGSRLLGNSDGPHVMVRVV